MASASSEVTDTTNPAFDLALHKSTVNRLDYLYEISHIPEDSKIPITDFPIVNLYTVFDIPQTSFKKSMKKFLGPSHPSTVKEYVQHPTICDQKVICLHSKALHLLKMP